MEALTGPRFSAPEQERILNKEAVTSAMVEALTKAARGVLDNHGLPDVKVKTRKIGPMVFKVSLEMEEKKLKIEKLKRLKIETREEQEVLPAVRAEKEIDEQAVPEKIKFPKTVQAFSGASETKGVDRIWLRKHDEVTEPKVKVENKRPLITADKIEEKAVIPDQAVPEAKVQVLSRPEQVLLEPLNTVAAIPQTIIPNEVDIKPSLVFSDTKNIESDTVVLAKPQIETVPVADYALRAGFREGMTQYMHSSLSETNFQPQYSELPLAVAETASAIESVQAPVPESAPVMSSAPVMALAGAGISGFTGLTGPSSISPGGFSSMAGLGMASAVPVGGLSSLPLAA